ncbi:MAG: FecR family protein [Nitrospirota bacterium]
MGGYSGHKGDMVLKALCVLSVIVLYLLSSVSSPFAEESIGIFSSVVGKVDVLRGGLLPARPVKKGDPVKVKDIVRTKSKGKAEIAFNDGNIVRIAPRSRVDISEYTVEKGTIGLPVGKIEAVVEKKNTSRIAASKRAIRFEICTPNAIAGVRGTDYFVHHTASVTGIIVKEGSVYTYSPEFPKDIVVVTAGTMTTVESLKTPRQPREVPKEELQKYEQEVAPMEQTGSAEGEQASAQRANTVEPSIIKKTNAHSPLPSSSHQNTKPTGPPKINVEKKDKQSSNQDATNAFTPASGKSSAKSSKTLITALGADSKALNHKKDKLNKNQRPAAAALGTTPKGTGSLKNKEIKGEAFKALTTGADDAHKKHKTKNKSDYDLSIPAPPSGQGIKPQSPVNAVSSSARSVTIGANAPGSMPLASPAGPPTTAPTGLSSPAPGGSVSSALPPLSLSSLPPLPPPHPPQPLVSSPEAPKEMQKEIWKEVSKEHKKVKK